MVHTLFRPLCQPYRDFQADLRLLKMSQGKGHWYSLLLPPHPISDGRQDIGKNPSWTMQIKSAIPYYRTYHWDFVGFWCSYDFPHNSGPFQSRYECVGTPQWNVLKAFLPWSWRLWQTNKKKWLTWKRKKKFKFELFEVLLSDFQTLWREVVKQSIPNFGSPMSTNHFLDLL